MQCVSQINLMDLIKINGDCLMEIHRDTQCQSKSFFVTDYINMLLSYTSVGLVLDTDVILIFIYNNFKIQNVSLNGARW